MSINKNGPLCDGVNEIGDSNLKVRTLIAEEEVGIHLEDGQRSQIFSFLDELHRGV